MALRIIDRFELTGQTVDVANSTLGSYVVPNGSAAVAVAYLTGATSGGDAVAYILNAGVKRFGGGVAVLIGAGSTASLSATDAALAAAICALTVTSNSLIVNVTGVATKTINWWGELQIWAN